MKWPIIPPLPQPRYVILWGWMVVPYSVEVQEMIDEMGLEAEYR